MFSIQLNSNSIGKSHETKIQLKPIFIDEFKIPFQSVCFTLPKTNFPICLAGSDKDFLFSIYSALSVSRRPPICCWFSFEAYVHVPNQLRFICMFMAISGFSIGRIINQFSVLFVCDCICIFRVHQLAYNACTKMLDSKFTGTIVRWFCALMRDINQDPIIFTIDFRFWTVINTQTHSYTSECKHWTLMTAWYWCLQHINATIFQYAEILCIKVNQTSIKYHLCVSKSLESIGDDLQIHSHNGLLPLLQLN